MAGGGRRPRPLDWPRTTPLEGGRICGALRGPTESSSGPHEAGQRAQGGAGGGRTGDAAVRRLAARQASEDGRRTRSAEGPVRNERNWNQSGPATPARPPRADRGVEGVVEGGRAARLQAAAGSDSPDLGRQGRQRGEAALDWRVPRAGRGPARPAFGVDVDAPSSKVSTSDRDDLKGRPHVLTYSAEVGTDSAP